jgi:DNA-binding phage protein
MTDLHPTVQALHEAQRRSGRSVAEVARAAGLSKASIYDWRSRRVPTVTNLDAALRAVGLRLAVVPVETEGRCFGAKPGAAHE